MTPVPTPATRTAWSDEPPNPARQEYRARERFTIYSISVAAHVASLGHAVERAMHGTKTVWSAPIAAKRDADHYQMTLRAFDRAMKSQQVASHDATA